MNFKSAARIYPIGLLSGIAVMFAELIPSLVFSDIPMLYKKTFLSLGLILAGIGFASNGVTGIVFKNMQGRVGNFYTLEKQGRVLFSIDVIMFLSLGTAMFYLAGKIALGTLLIKF